MGVVRLVPVSAETSEVGRAVDVRPRMDLTTFTGGRGAPDEAELGLHPSFLLKPLVHRPAAAYEHGAASS